MLKFIDNFLNRITMYRLVLYILTVFFLVALIFSAVGLLPFKPLNLFVSAAIIVTASYYTNKLFAKLLHVHTNIDSVYISAFILTLVINPPVSFSDWRYFGFMMLAAVLAQASKYLLAVSRVHIFNPAAFGVAATAIALQYAATWWVGNSNLLPVVLIGGLLIVRKIRRAYMVISFFSTLVVVTFALGFSSGSALRSVESVVWSGVTMFFAFIMFTEPQTSPPTEKLQILYGVLVGALYSPFVHIRTFYFTPELALLTGNVYSYMVSPKQRLVLTLKEKIKVADGVFHFIFQSSDKLRHKPGQYLEWTLDHPKPDTRGNRRYFTVASAPHEHGVHAGIKFHDEPSSFKKHLSELKPGDTLTASHVAGDFTLPKDPHKKLAFLAGGIGITPFRSMVSSMTAQNEQRDTILLYSAKTPNEFAYKDLLDQASQKIPLKTVYTVTDEAPKDWHGHTGFINRATIEQEIPDFSERIFYLSGPLTMVDAFSDLLSEMGVHPKNIKKDFFPGYV